MTKCQGALIAAGIGAALTATVAGCGSNQPADYQAGYSFAQQHTTQFYESGDLPAIFCNIRVPLELWRPRRRENRMDRGLRRRRAQAVGVAQTMTTRWLGIGDGAPVRRPS